MATIIKVLFVGLFSLVLLALPACSDSDANAVDGATPEKVTSKTYSKDDFRYFLIEKDGEYYSPACIGENKSIYCGRFVIKEDKKFVLGNLTRQSVAIFTRGNRIQSNTPLSMDVRVPVGKYNIL